MSLRISVLAIGDELLSGELSDTNTAAIARLLAAKGFALQDSRSVRDLLEPMVEALRALAAQRDCVIVTGGLGPTADDLTAQAAALAFACPQQLNAEALAQVQRHFERLGREMHPRNEKQAHLPQGIEILPNHQGTAPGFRLQHGGCELFFLPGVPAEMVAMLEQSVLPALLRRVEATDILGERILKVFGLSEPKTEELLEQIGMPTGVQVAFGVDFPCVHVKLRAMGEDAEALLDQAEQQARRALGEFIFARGADTLAETVGRQLIQAGKTLALAESCTGGLIAQLLTDLPGASAFFERGGVTYANRAKCDWLQVPVSLLEEQGAVSEACALAMARGIRQVAGTDLGLAVTGIAGPTGGTPDKPVGTVFIALTTAATERVQRFHFSGDRRKVRLLTACMGLDWLRRQLAVKEAE
ncbi:MAG: CinA family nicotinamide mononucleotide deamidase-related protein [Desulfuromonadaceae bacterium]|jgi:nicotinamide-nucleotide amidase